MRVHQVQRNLDRVIANKVKVDVEPDLTHRGGESRALVLGLVVEGRVKAELVAQELNLGVCAGAANDA